MNLAPFKNRFALSGMLVNAGWLVTDKIIRLGGGLLVTVWIARYLGPSQFGQWNYAVAFATLFGSLAALGLDTIVVRDLVRNTVESPRILGTVFVLKIAAATTATLAATAATMLLKPGNTEMAMLVALAASMFVFQATNVLDFYFLSKTRSKFSVLAQNAAFIIMSGVKIALLLDGATLMNFAAATLGEAALTAVFLVWIFHAQRNSVRQWRFDSAYASRVLKDGVPLILAGLAVSVYMRIDQIMLGELAGNQAVGIFSAATRISEAWYFVPMAIVNSAIPTMVEKHRSSREEYLAAMQKLYDVMLVFAVAVAVIVTLLASKIASTLYGAGYAGVDTILMLHIWAGVFVCLGLASGSALTTEGLQKYSMYRTLIGCVANIGLNCLFIPAYGAVGAAISTIISYGVSVYSIGLYPRGREIFLSLLRSLNVLRAIRLLQASS